MSPVPAADVNGLTLAYETFGEPSDPAILLIMGLGAQMIEWDERFCDALVGRGFHVIRFDNRDVGESTWLDTPGFDPGSVALAILSGEEVEVPYLLADMADDAAGLLDHLGIEAAHVVGASLGGMIAQSVAVGHPHRVRSLVSIMSTTGDPDVGQPEPEVALALIEPRPAEGEAAIAATVEIVRLISCAEHFDEAKVRARAQAALARGINPLGTARQLIAMLASGSRSDALSRLAMPALVVHGRQDPLVAFSGGERTASVIPGAEFVAIDDMAHDLPEVHWGTLIDRIIATACRAD